MGATEVARQRLKWKLPTTAWETVPRLPAGGREMTMDTLPWPIFPEGGASLSASVTRQSGLGRGPVVVAFVKLRAWAGASRGHGSWPAYHRTRLG